VRVGDNIFCSGFVHTTITRSSVVFFFWECVLRCGPKLETEGQRNDTRDPPASDDYSKSLIQPERISDKGKLDTVRLMSGRHAEREQNSESGSVRGVPMLEFDPTGNIHRALDSKVAIHVIVPGR